MQTHWQRVYTEKAPTAVSWYQSNPALSLELILATTPTNVIDIGGGASTLVDHLLQQPNINPCVLDIAAPALQHARQRLGSKLSSRVRWIEADATADLPALPDQWADVWHDRAVFHFLTTPESQFAYAKNLARILKPNGTAIISTFALDGPEKCSDLPVCRHDAASIAAAISCGGKPFKVLHAQNEIHTTPWGKPQSFIYVVLKSLAAT